MKINDNLWRMFVVLIVSAMSFGFISCSKDGDDESEPFITVNGASSSEHTFPGAFNNGKSGIDYKQVFKIKSNVEWTLTGKVNWLNISSLSGNGEVDLSIYPTSEHDSDEPREAILVLSAADKSVSIKIVQEGKYVECYVVPANEVALYDRFCWEYMGSPNVNEFQYMLLSETDLNRMTDKELRKELMEKFEDEPFKFDDGYISMLARDEYGSYLSPNTTYYYVSLATDKEGNYGSLQKVKLKTPAYLDEDEDAYVSFGDFGYNSYMFQFDVEKEGYCNTYHMIYGVYYESLNSAVFAFEINYYIKNKKKHWLAKNEYYEWDIITDYPNNHTFSYTNYYMSYYPVCFGYGWGVFKDGKMSSDLLGFQYDTTSSASPRMMVSNNSSDDTLENIIIRRSEVMECMKELCK